MNKTMTPKAARIILTGAGDETMDAVIRGCAVAGESLSRAFVAMVSPSRRSAQGFDPAGRLSDAIPGLRETAAGISLPMLC